MSFSCSLDKPVELPYVIISLLEGYREQAMTKQAVCKRNNVAPAYNGVLFHHHHFRA